jgi:hypothetical protein
MNGIVGHGAGMKNGAYIRVAVKNAQRFMARLCEQRSAAHAKKERAAGKK